MFDVETDLRNEAQKVITIFQNEARMKRISLSMVIGESVERLGVHAVKTDPVRLGQVYVICPSVSPGTIIWLTWQGDQLALERHPIHVKLNGQTD